MEWLSIRSVTEQLQVSRVTVNQWMNSGLRFHKLSDTPKGHVRIARPDLDAFLLRRRSDKLPPLRDYQNDLR